jgi:rubredoxin
MVGTMACPNCGFSGDPETGEMYDVTFPCPKCGLGGAKVRAATRVASRFLKAAGYFAVGDLVWMGKYKNKLAIITAFGEDAKGNPTITISPIPKGRKQDKTFGLFKVWKVRPEQIAELKAKGKLAGLYEATPGSSRYLTEDEIRSYAREYEDDEDWEWR